jgi:hypothetical protein
MTENFRSVLGFSRYIVGDFGTVRSTIRRGRTMKPWVEISHGQPGYPRVSLMTDDGSTVVKVRVKVRVHQLVAQAFIPNPNNLPTVNHKNGIKADNRAVNLEWSSYAEQNEHGRQNGLINDFGENYYLAQFTNNQVLAIRQRAAKGESNRQLADEFGVHIRSIQRIVNRERWARI